MKTSTEAVRASRSSGLCDVTVNCVTMQAVTALVLLRTILHKLTEQIAKLLSVKNQPTTNVADKD